LIYDTPNIARLEIKPGLQRASADKGEGGASAVAILSAVQSAYEELGISREYSTEVKRRLLDFAAKGELDLLVYHAIVDVFPASSDQPQIKAEC
jgi:hypothetical protein